MGEDYVSVLPMKKGRVSFMTTRELVIVAMEGEHRIDSRLVAESLGIEHEVFIVTQDAVSLVADKEVARHLFSIERKERS